jgi:hypothetical protein
VLCWCFMLMLSLIDAMRCVVTLHYMMLNNMIQNNVIRYDEVWCSVELYNIMKYINCNKQNKKKNNKKEQ